MRRRGDALAWAVRVSRICGVMTMLFREGMLKRMVYLLAGDHILRIHRGVGAVFDFHDDGAGFERVDGVPLAGGDVEGDVGADD